MAKKDYLDQLADAAEELNTVLGLEPPIVTANTTLGALKKAIGEAQQLIAPEDTLTKETQAVLDGLDKGTTEPAPAKVDGHRMEIVREIEATTNRRELKLIAKKHDVFSEYIKELGTITDSEGLQSRMIELVLMENAKPETGSIADTIDDNMEPAIPAKPEKKAPEAPAPKKPKGTAPKRDPNAPKTKFGHNKASQAGLIDEALIKHEGKPVELDVIAEEIGSTRGRVKSHIKHLQVKKKIDIKVEGRVVTLAKGA